MIWNIPLLPDFQALNLRRQLKVDQNLVKMNSKRHDHDYQVGQRVLLMNPNPSKLGPITSGPFTITQVYVNGTVRVQRTPIVSERINIRRIRPYRQ